MAQERESVLIARRVLFQQIKNLRGSHFQSRRQVPNKQREKHQFASVNNNALKLEEYFKIILFYSNGARDRKETLHCATWRASCLLAIAQRWHAHNPKIINWFIWIHQGQTKLVQYIKTNKISMLEIWPKWLYSLHRYLEDIFKGVQLTCSSHFGESWRRWLVRALLSKRLSGLDVVPRGGRRWGGRTFHLNGGRRHPRLLAPRWAQCYPISPPSFTTAFFHRLLSL